MELPMMEQLSLQKIGRRHVDAQPIQPLLFPRHQLLTLSDSSRRLYSQAEDQYTNTNKFTLLLRALKSGSVSSATILVNFTRPVDFQRASFSNKKAYLRHLFAAVMLGDETSLEELYRVIDQFKKINDVILLQKIIKGYENHGFDLMPYLQKITEKSDMLLAHQQ